MPYEFLKDGTPFTALSLTTRFDTLVSDVNAVTADAVQFLGLGPEQLPSLVGTHDASLTETLSAENLASAVTVPSSGGSPPLVRGDEFHAVLAPSETAFQLVRNEGFSVQLLSTGGHTLSRTGGASNVTALMVLANVEVRQFDPTQIEVVAARGDVGTSGQPYPHRYWGLTLNEYEWDATVILELVDSTGARGYLPRTERQLSPRVTIGAYNNMGEQAYPDPPEEGALSSMRNPYLQGRNAMSPLRDLPGHTESPGSDFSPAVEQFDHRTYQDVSIRTIITQADLSRVKDADGAAVTLADVQVVRFGFGSLNKRRYFVQRANITALPLLAEVKADT